VVGAGREEGGLNELALFAGAGGGILGGHLLGWRCVCAVEFNAYARSVLLARQNDGTLPPFPVWDDVRTFDGRPWRGHVDVVSGGFPCQDISVAGKGDGLDGERSGLWSEMARIIGEVRPRFAFVENSPMLTSRGLGRVLGDLSALGFDAEWGVLGARDVGAPHQRDRIWIVAHANGVLELQPTWCKCNERNGPCECSEAVADAARSECNRNRAEPGGQSDGPANGGEAVADSSSQRQQKSWNTHDASDCQKDRRREASHAFYVGEWPSEPGLGRMAHGVANRTDRLKAIGNGQVSRVAATAWRLLTEAA
jgi:DNA (cytosine-5)-methyltransferase 1